MISMTKLKSKKFPCYEIKKGKSLVTLKFTQKTYETYPENIDRFIEEISFSYNLDIMVIDGYLYFVDFGKNDVYSVIYNGYGVCLLFDLDSILQEHKLFKCYKLSKKDSKILMQISENGY